MFTKKKLKDFCIESRKKKKIFGDTTNCQQKSSTSAYERREEDKKGENWKKSRHKVGARKGTETRLQICGRKASLLFLCSLMLRSLGGGIVSDGISELKSFPSARGLWREKNYSSHIRAAIFVAARDKKLSWPWQMVGSRMGCSRFAERVEHCLSSQQISRN